MAPAANDPALLDAIAALRSKGEIVIQQLGVDSESREELNCDRRLEKQGESWVVITID